MKWKPVAALVLLFIAIALGGCSDDEATDPTTDEPPEVTIVDAPFSAAVGETVEVHYIATDDVGLAQLSVSWGTFEAPVEIVFASGDEFEGVASHEYTEADTYLITVGATDTDGRTGRAEVEVTVEP